jgi:hypothetical protein
VCVTPAPNGDTAARRGSLGQLPGEAHIQADAVEYLLVQHQ